MWSLPILIAVILSHVSCLLVFEALYISKKEDSYQSPIFYNMLGTFVTSSLSLGISGFVCINKLDWVAPLITNPPPTSSTTLSNIYFYFLQKKVPQET